MDYGYGDTVQYGYGEDSAQYNHGDATPTAQYGYGEDTAQYGCEEANPAAQYGYGEATPADQYGYGEATPAAQYEYGGATPAAQYGYGEATPMASSATRMPRRSSLKSASGAPRRASISYKGEINVQLPDRTVVRRRRSIGFQQENEVKEVEPVAKQGDKRELWWQDEESEEIIEKTFHLVEYARRVGPEGVAKKKLNTRGLEHHIDPEEYKEIRDCGQFAVLREQDHQRNQGKYDCTAIGKFYSTVSAYSQEKAQKLAEMDYEAVKKEHRRTRRMFRRSSM